MATFGTTSIGSNTTGHGTDDSVVNKFTLSEDGDVSKLTAYTKGTLATENSKGVIYSDNAGEPEDLLGTSNSTSVSTTAAWRDYTFASVVSLTAGDYWLGVVSDGPITSYNETTGGSRRISNDSSYTSPVDPWNVGSDSAGSHDTSVYATYTATGGGGSRRVFNIN